MAVRLIDSLSTTEPLAEIFSDNSILQAMLDFEIALARAEARAGIIPQNAADAIAAAARTSSLDVAAIARGGLSAATVSIPFVKALTTLVNARSAEAAKFVHWGATSQDVADTAMILLLKRTRPALVADLTRTESALRTLADEHSQTVMLGRTLMQAAPPATFGLKAAGWLGAIRRSRVRLESAFREALVVEFGGATGTLAALGDRGVEVGAALADELGLQFPDAPWHTQRDRLAALVCASGVLTGALGKMARDVALMAQTEVAEVAEPGEPGRGRSSTMPHKRNPVGSVIALAAANRVPGLVASFLSGMVQEHERSAGGWQSEWPTISNVVQATGVAAASMAEVAEGLSVDEQKMRKNIDATNGLVFAERAMILLGPALGRDAAHRLVEQATRRSVEEKKSLAEVLREIPEVKKVLEPSTLASLDDPKAYLGVADEFRTRLLAQGRDSKK